MSFAVFYLQRHIIISCPVVSTDLMLALQSHFVLFPCHLICSFISFFLSLSFSLSCRPTFLCPVMFLFFLPTILYSLCSRLFCHDSVTLADVCSACVYVCVCVLYVTLTATHDWSQTWVLTDDSRLNVTKSKRPQTQLWLKPWLVISFFWLEKYAQSVKKKKKLNAILWSPVDFSHKACCVSHKYDERISLLIKHFKSRVVCIHLYLCLLYLLFCGPRFIAATCRSVVYCGTISCSV